MTCRTQRRLTSVGRLARSSPTPTISPAPTPTISYSQMSKSQPTAKSPSPIPEWLRGLIQRTKIDATGQESVITSLATTSLCASSVASSTIVLKSSATILSRGQLAAPGTEFAVDSNKTFRSRVLEYTNVSGTALAPLVEAIPVAGTPLKAAIGTLLGILAIIDVSVRFLGRHPTHFAMQNLAQNKQALKALTTKLRWLLNRIYVLPEATSSGMQLAQQDIIQYFMGIFTH